MGYLFLFGLAFVWLIFATIQDWRTREISNWLNFSLISFALAYRAFYSSFSGNWNFFLFGLTGFFLFLILGYALYYGRAFAGGDAKLLMALGAVLPFESLYSLFLGVGFVFLLFLAGAVYGLVYMILLVSTRFSVIYPAFKKELHTRTSLLFIIIGTSIFMTGFVLEGLFSLAFMVLGMLLALSWPLTKAVENKVMIKKVKVSDLTEGDWLVQDITVNGKIIRKNFKGLTWDEIKLLRKHKKEVMIKDGVPFAFSFLLAFVIMVFFFLTDKLILFLP